MPLYVNPNAGPRTSGQPDAPIIPGAAGNQVAPRFRPLRPTAPRTPTAPVTPPAVQTPTPPTTMRPVPPTRPVILADPNDPDGNPDIGRPSGNPESDYPRNPGPGTTPPRPATPPPPPPAPLPPIDTGAPTFDTNLRGNVYAPGADPRLTAAQGRTDAAASAVAGAPMFDAEASDIYNRFRPLLSGGQTRLQAAQALLGNLEQSTSDARQLGIRDIGRASARFGRMGSGKVTTDLGNLEDRLDINRQNTLRQLAADTTEGDINDRFRTLDYGMDAAGQNAGQRMNRLTAAQGVEDQTFGQGESNRNELRTERGYQQGAAQQSLDNRIRERSIAEQERSNRLTRAIALMQAGGRVPDLGTLVN